MKPKGTRVWVAVSPSGVVLPFTARRLRFDAQEAALDSSYDYRTVTIRRATLVLDPVKPRKRKGAA